jgi:phospholipid/cholesterol/gamma-HCH transport system permease protein
MADAHTEVREEAGGRVLVKLRGRLDAQSTAICWRELERRLRSLRVTTLEVDASGVTLAGGIGAALLRYLAEAGMTPGAHVALQGLSPEAQGILDTFSAEDFRSYRPRRRQRSPSALTEAGEFGKTLWRDFAEQITFLGSVATALPVALLHPKRMRWREVRRVMESAGANALPVVSLISALVGVVTVLEAAHPLAQFGAQIFLADMIGFSSLRDTGPVVTAILLAGRSGAAFAAELGTMKVNQELDALTTMGLNPIGYLVVQRVVAALLLTPLLTLYAMFMGIVGGLIIMRSLGFPPLMIFHQILGRVSMNDLLVGSTKAALFGLILGSMACLRGLQTGQGPSAVGVSTTRSVIACILLIILVNTLYSAVQYFWS